MRGMSKTLACVVAGVAGVSAAGAWMLHRGAGDADVDAFIRQSGNDLRHWTVPPGSRVVRESSTVHRDFGAETSWDFQAATNWTDYSRWVRQELPSDYRAVSAGDGAMDFSRHFPGDVEHLHIEPMPGGPPLQVRAVLRVEAD